MRNHRWGITGGSPGSLSTGWNNRAASDYVHFVANKFGQPSAVDPTKNGIAIWKRELLGNTCLNRIEVRDEAVPHAMMRHLDYVYVFVDYEISEARQMDIYSVTNNVGYDKTKKQLWARCSTVEGCIGILALCTQIGNTSITPLFAKANEMLQQYLIASQSTNSYTQLYNLLCYNLTATN